MQEVKGGIVIEQLKKYAERLMDAEDESASVKIDVWCHKHDSGDKELTVALSGYSYSKNVHIIPRFKTDDLRDLGKAIEDYLSGYK